MTEQTEETKSALQKTEASPKSEPSWVDKTRDLIGGAFLNVGKVLPVQQATDTVIGWFSVDEAEIAEILQKVRSELPTTEAILVGKPQAGKSSIIRGLTGVSAEIIGQGFRPHTRFTQRYSYPTDDLPLLVFTDTVGLGDGTQETTEVIKELVGEIQEDEETRAKVLILTVKITDFATDTLRQIASRIRQQHPEVPCLLVVTCLHELYPPDVIDHPAYPPDYEDGNRAFAALQKGFQGLFDRAIQIDFTLEEDGFTPTFYGLETLVDTLADLLPEAEARTISQLLDDRDAGKQISDIYREAGRRYILPFSVMAGALAAIPLPLATMPVLTALQVSMVGALGQLYGQTLTPSQAGGVVSAIAGGFVAQAIGRELIKFIPGFGSVIAASWATAYTWSLGETACVYFGDLMGGKKPDPKRIQAVMKESFEVAKTRFQSAKK
ncbi:YcjF family protein [Phormidesmis priestleyi]